jgi:EF-P beta-lysylation protein EpmB
MSTQGKSSGPIAGPVASQDDRWRRELAQGFKDPAALLEFLGLDAASLAPAEAATQPFPLRVPRYFAGLMRRNDPRDPLLLQVLPTDAERLEVPGFVADPVQDLSFALTTGVLQKYAGRALLIATGACAVHCRYCFRRHFPYSDALASAGRWDNALRELAHRADITEVILSGGDPLTLPDEPLAALVERLEALPHVRRLRIHSRVPVVLPGRLTEGLTRLLARSRLAVSLVLHSNHPNELSGVLKAALEPLREAKVVLLNQAVLLAGINDQVPILESLSETLFELGVLPYYLHQLDPVAGAAHFHVDEDRARSLHEALRSRLPGYLLPRLVVERPGMTAKVPL